jgi:formylmethanofuran dehydrogenase subunit E
MTEFETYLKKAGEFHGHACVGIALGTRITLAAMKALGLKPGEKNKNLIVFTEIDRCMTDAVQAITGCSLGRRSLKHMDYGKFAATFVNLETGKAVRGSVKEHFGNDKPLEETLNLLAGIPDDKLVTLQEVTVNIPETDLPGPPKQKAVCTACGEPIMDGRGIKDGNKTLCRTCAQGGYYRESKTRKKVT